MASEVTSLYKQCMRRTVKLLQESYWNPELPLDENPFHLLPSLLVDGLIDTVVGTDPYRPLQFSSHLRLLLRSGKVRDFRCFIEPSSKGQKILEEILLDLASSCSSLRSVTISTRSKNWGVQLYATNEFKYLLRKARNIRHIDSDVHFDVRSLHNSDKLETLVLNFHFRICDFLEVDGKFRPHTSLREFMVDEELECSTSDVALLLKYCTQLTSTNCDISRSLEHLHGEELRNGSLTHRYKLRKCRLGKEAYDYFLAPVVRIASLTCPLLQDLKLYAEDNETVSALGDCLNLENLTVIFPFYDYGDYTKGMRGLLEKPEIGHRLKALAIYNISNVDFSSVRMCCPNLERLDVTYGSIFSMRTLSPNIFEKLRFLKLKTLIESEIPTGLICSALNLERLTFSNSNTFGHPFTDDLLSGIMIKNSLSKLKHFGWYYSRLSLDGWRNLARSLTALESVNVCIVEDLFTKDEVRAVFSEINPRVSVKLCV